MTQNTKDGREWAADHRVGWVRNGLKAAAGLLRLEERRARARFAKDSETSAIWREPANAVADAYAEAAEVFERRLAELAPTLQEGSG